MSPRGGLVLKRRPLLRDVSAYAVSLTLLMCYIHDEKVTLGRSSMFLLVYVVFCLVVATSPTINRKLLQGVGRFVGSIAFKTPMAPASCIHERSDNADGASLL